MYNEGQTFQIDPGAVALRSQKKKWENGGGKEVEEIGSSKVRMSLPLRERTPPLRERTPALVSLHQA